jgi:hypothetical protein
MRQAISAGAQDALLRVGPFFSSTQRRTMIDLAAELRLPVMYDRREYVEQGGLVTYAPDNSDLYRRAACTSQDRLEGAIDKPELLGEASFGLAAGTSAFLDSPEGARRPPAPDFRPPARQWYPVDIAREAWLPSATR